MKKRPKRKAKPKPRATTKRAVIDARTIQVPTSIAATGTLNLQLELVQCGKADCKRCRRRPTHGPYWYAYCWSPRSRKMISRYVGKELERLRSRPWFAGDAAKFVQLDDDATGEGTAG